MENLNFVLGILSTVGVFLLGYASVGIFKVKKQVSDIFTSIDGVYRCLEDTHISILDSIEKKQATVHKRCDSLSLDIEEVYRQMDSRFDKLENKLKK